MLDRIRTAMSSNTIPTYTDAELAELGREYRAGRVRLAEIRQLPIEEIERLYRDAETRGLTE